MTCVRAANASRIETANGSDRSGGGFVLRGNGKHFDRAPFPGKALRAVWGTASDSVWVAGYDGEIHHFNGKTWQLETTLPNAQLLNLWGSAPNDIWASGLAGAIFHSDGKTWTKVPSSTDKVLWSTWGSSSANVWAVGPEGTLLRYNGQKWRAE